MNQRRACAPSSLGVGSRLSVIGVLLCLACPASPWGTNLESLEPRDVSAAFEKYAAGDFEAAVRELLGGREVRAISRDFRREAGRWIDQAPAALRPRRLVVASAMTVEVMAASFAQDWFQYEESRVLVEWACERLRRGPPTEFERRFHLASIALLQGTRDESLLSGVRRTGSLSSIPGGGSHVLHGGHRFPAESRFKLAYVTTRPETQLLTTGQVTPAELVDGYVGRFQIDRPGTVAELEDTLQKLAMLSDDAAVGSEARLRSGVLRFLRGHWAAAGADLGVARGSSDTGIRYVAELLLGTLAEQAGRLTEALTHYRQAHDAVPASRSSVVLASFLYRTGRIDEAAAVLRAYDAAPPITDPWHLYGQRDYRLFPEYQRAMRQEAVR